MTRPGVRHRLILTVDALLFVLCLLHIPSLNERARPPFTLGEGEDGPVVKKVLDPAAGEFVKPGDVLLTWDGRRVSIPEVATEFLPSFYRIDDLVAVTIDRSGVRQSGAIKLIPYYTPLRLIVTFYFVGAILFAMGVFILVSRPDERVGRLLHWVLISFGAAVMLGWGAVVEESLRSLIYRSMFFLSYAVVPAGLVLFATEFPRSRFAPLNLKKIMLGAPLGLVTAVVLYAHLRAIHRVSIEDYSMFQSWYDLFHATVLLYVGAGVLVFLSTLTIVRTAEERRQVRWILWGLGLGVAPFLLLIVLPLLLSMDELVQEEYTTFFFLVVPISLVVSFLKYRARDLQRVLHRGLVYVLLTLFVVAVLFLALLLIVPLLRVQTVLEESVVIALVALVIALVFDEARHRVQKGVDRVLFPARVGFREAIRSAGERLYRALSDRQLFEALVESVGGVVACESVGVYRREGSVWRLETASGTPIPEGFPAEAGEPAGSRAFALRSVLEQKRDDIDFSREEILRRAGFSLFLPLAGEGEEARAALLLRVMEKERLQDEEIDYLLTVCRQAEESLERLLVQERMIIEREEKRRLEELNRLKSDFVSYVSHELRTPLTSITLFSELLLARLRGSDSKSVKYVRVIEAESERLARMVANILDAARIDHEGQIYSFKDLDLRSIVKRALKSMEYQLRQHRFHVEVNIAAKPLPVRADADSFALAVTNLISNAIKYSAARKYLKVSLHRRGAWGLCRVRDRGIGIPRANIPHLFDRFYRSPSVPGRVQGVGLGLSVVKDVVDAHRGRIEVSSTVGRGSTFSVWIPLAESVYVGES